MVGDGVTSIWLRWLPGGVGGGGGVERDRYGWTLIIWRETSSARHA